MQIRVMNLTRSMSSSHWTAVQYVVIRCWKHRKVQHKISLLLGIKQNYTSSLRRTRSAKNSRAHWYQALIHFCIICHLSIRNKLIKKGNSLYQNSLFRSFSLSQKARRIYFLSPGSPMQTHISTKNGGNKMPVFAWNARGKIMQNLKKAILHITSLVL